MSANDSVVPGLATAQRRERAESLLVTAYRSGITDAKELANFMGQTQHESQNFSRLEENLNYRGSVLWDTFKGGGKVLPRNGLTEMEAGELAAIEDPRRRHKAIANKMYGGEWGESFLGNTQPDDGYNFRGRGYIQLTGRDNYATYQRKTGLDLVNQPELAADPGNAETLAVQYWKDNVQPKTRDRGSVTDAASIINTGKIGRAVKGLADRQANATAWETALGKDGYLEGVLERHPVRATHPSTAVEKEAQPTQTQPAPPLSPQSQRLIQDSEHHVRQLAERHQLPWNQGMDNTVHAVAQQAREQGMTGITHLKVRDGQIRYAQQDGFGLREGQVDARAAANTNAADSLSQLVGNDQRVLANAQSQATPQLAEARTAEARVVSA